MRQLLIPFLILLSCSAHAELPSRVHKLCLEAKDYAGCVKAMTITPTAGDDSLTQLRNAMKQVAARLRSGTSLRDSTETFRPVVDQLAIVEASHPDAFAVKTARLASRMFEALQLAWDTRIKASQHDLNRYGGIPMYDCEALKRTVDIYNAIPGAPYVDWRYTKGVLGWTACKVPAGQLPELYISRSVVRVLDEGAVSPADIAAAEKAEQDRRAKVDRERELCALGPWNKYLEDNPGIKKWALANPVAAEAAKTKFLADPKNNGGCGLTTKFGMDMNSNFLF